MTNLENPTRIAEMFNKSYEKLWNKNMLDELVKLYCKKSILVGYKTVTGKMKLNNLLKNHGAGLDKN